MNNVQQAAYLLHHQMVHKSYYKQFAEAGAHTSVWSDTGYHVLHSLEFLQKKFTTLIHAIMYTRTHGPIQLKVHQFKEQPEKTLTPIDFEMSWHYWLKNKK